MQQRDVLGRTGLAELAQRRLLAGLVCILQRLDAVHMGLAVERGLQRRPQVADEGLHARAQRGAAPRGHGEQLGFERLVEVVQIAQVGRHRLARGALTQQTEGGGVLAGARVAEHEDVIAGVPHGQTKADGLDGALLAKVAGMVGKGFGGFESEAGRVALLAQRRRRQRHMIGHV